MKDSFGHTWSSRLMWMVAASLNWALVFDMFYNQHAHHGRFMLMLGLAVFATLNTLVPAYERLRQDD